MIFRILKSNQAYNLILFPLIGVILWLPSAISPEIYTFAPGENQTVLFAPLFNIVKGNAFVQVVVSLGLMIILGFFLQKLNNQFTFFRVRTMLPSNLMILFVSAVAPLHSLHPVYFAALFLLFAIDREFSAFEKKSINTNSFDTGFLVGLGSLFYVNLIFLFPALVLGMRILNREFDWKKLILIFWGLILPWIFSFSYYFLIGHTGDLLSNLETNLFSTNNRLAGNLPMQIYAGFTAFTLAIGGLMVITQFDKQKISTRKFYSILLLLVASLLLMFFLSPFASIEIFVLLAIPASFIFSYALLNFKIRFIADLLLFIFLGLAVYMQLA